MSSNSDPWVCKEDGKCCSLFVRTGPHLSGEEVQLIASRMESLGYPADNTDIIMESHYIPLIGDTPPKSCIFLEDNRCKIHDIKPQDCKFYPLQIDTRDDTIRIIISLECPRGEDIEQAIKDGNIPHWLEEQLVGKEVKTEFRSDYEERIKYYKG